MIEKANHTKNDNVNSIDSISADKKGIEPDVATASTSSHSSPESEVKQGEGSPSSNVPSPSKDVVREVEGEATESTASVMMEREFLPQGSMNSIIKSTH